ncbi:hypothetical protein BS47DRAFT_1343789 [Hydnum rufescens UP504]|uniref:Tricalbin n=1 Tax=Hydnum rufescens UP504 TaxID=1448309 RepID=A0A9P6AXE8_9AGAM|nr:hypothetical protein BS47DRAFT_1343789 [Hydnum rufescens UP504]
MDPIALDTLQTVQQRDEAKGAIVHVFDPNASPQEKAAQAASTGGPSIGLQAGRSDPGVAKEIKLDSGAAPPIQPTISIQDVDKTDEGTIKSPLSPTELDKQPVPGELLDAIAPTIPDWYRVGWRMLTIMSFRCSCHDMYYGQWYHNAGVIFFAVLSTYFITLFRLGWGWLFIILAICATYYSASIERVRRSSRDDIQRELVKTRLLSEHESADWLNNFLDRFWLIYEPVLSSTIVASVDPILSASTPGFLDSLRMTTFTLGSKAPRIEHVRTFPNTPDDVILMDWTVSFNSITDPSQPSSKHLIGKTSSKIVLDVRFGKGIATAGIPILIENMDFSGEMRVKLKLINSFPHVQIVELSFLTKPDFSFVLKPIGGDAFGFDIANIPGLSSYIQDTVHSILQPMMYDPNFYTLNLEQLLSGTPLDAAAGVLRVEIISARDLKITKLGGGTPDPYISLKIENRAELARTKFKRSTSNPHFGSTHYLLLASSNLTETLNLIVLDHNDHLKDTEVGAASYELKRLLDDATDEGIVAKVNKDGKGRGEVSFNLSWFPVLTATKTADGQLEPIPETKVGIARLTIHQAKELDASHSITRDLNPSCKVLIRHQVVHKTPTLKHNSTPAWESAFEFLVSDRATSFITLKVVDARDLLGDYVVGREEQRDWFSLKGAKSGKLRMTAEWKPLAMAGGVQGAGAYQPPIGVVRTLKATDVKNIESGLGGKSDPYVRIMMNGVIKARTEIVNNNLNPEWDSIVYVPVHSLSETIILEVMDYQNLTKDRSLGSVDLAVKTLAHQNVTDMKYPFESSGKYEATDRIRLHGGTYKGDLHYVAEFTPALNLRGVSFDSGTEIDGKGDNEESGEDINGGARTRHVKSQKSVDTTVTVDSVDITKTDVTSANDEILSPPPTPLQTGVELSRAELLQSQSGILVINVISGQLAHKSHFELLLDDGYWPAFTTEKALSKTARWDQVGEGFVKELDFSQVWLRLNENEDGEREDIVGEFKIFAKAFLAECLDKEAEFKLPHDDGKESTVKIMAKFVPVPVNLEPRETINNMGSLRVELIGATDIRAADRGGKSDPYAVFTLNRQKVHKSEVRKKTLSPTWDETFPLMVQSRVASLLEVEIFDWNQIEQSESLGTAVIDLTALEPFQATKLSLPLVDPELGPKGEIHLRLVFTPEIIARSRKSTSTFSMAGRALTHVGTLPFGATRTFAGGIGESPAISGESPARHRGVASGIGGVGNIARGFFKKDKEKAIDEADEQNELPIISHPSKDSQPAVVPVGDHTFPSVVPEISTGRVTPPREQGILRGVIVGAKNLVSGDSIKPYVVAKLGDKEVKTKHTAKTASPEWDEPFAFLVGPELHTMTVTVLDHKSFLGKDKVLGEAEIDIWQRIQVGGPDVTAVDFWAELQNGAGELHLRMEYERGVFTGTRQSIGSVGARTPLSSPSRFSLPKRAPTNHDDSAHAQTQKL